MEGWQERLQHEFARAEAARTRGQEGQARVCARRAAGIAIREYFDRRGRAVQSASAMDLLALLSDEPAIAEPLKAAVEHLTVRVTEEFKLPVEADLVADSRALCRALLGWPAE